MSILLYIFLYLLGAVVSFFAFAKIMQHESHEADILVFESLIFPVMWVIIISLATWFMLQEYAEKYLEKINEGKDE